MSKVFKELASLHQNQAKVSEDGVSGQLAKITSLGLELGKSEDKANNNRYYSPNIIEDGSGYANDPFAGGDSSALELVAPTLAPIDLENLPEESDEESTDSDNRSLSLFDIHNKDNNDNNESDTKENNSPAPSDDYLSLDSELTSVSEDESVHQELLTKIKDKAHDLIADSSVDNKLNEPESFEENYDKAKIDNVYTLQEIVGDPFSEDEVKDDLLPTVEFSYDVTKLNDCLQQATPLLSQDIEPKNSSKEEILDYAVAQVQKFTVEKPLVNKTVVQDKTPIQNQNHKVANAALIPVDSNADTVDINENDIEIAVDDSDLDYMDMPLSNDQEMLFYDEAEALNDNSKVEPIKDGDPTKVSALEAQNAYFQSSQNLLSFSGKKLVDPNDFLAEVAKSDAWYQTILQAGYSSGPDYTALIYSSRKVDPDDHNKWTLSLSSDFSLLATDPTWQHNLQTKFSIANGAPVSINIQIEPKAADDCPYSKASALFINELNLKRQALMKNNKLTSLLKELGEDLFKIRIDLYKDIN